MPLQLPPRYFSYRASREESHRLPCLFSSSGDIFTQWQQCDACSWGVAPCSVCSNFNGRGTVSEQRETWYQAHVQIQGSGLEFVKGSLPLTVPSAHHLMQPSEAFRITESHTAAYWDVILFGKGSFAAKGPPFQSRTPLAPAFLKWHQCTVLPLAFPHPAAPRAWQQLPAVCPQPKPEQQLGQDEPKREEESQQSTPLPVEKQAAIQLGQQLLSLLSNPGETKTETLPPRTPESLSGKLHTSCAAQVQAGAGQPDQSSGSSSSFTISLLQEVPDQI
ncbi:unnamed protein product, partial [Polarella glacialis]